VAGSSERVIRLASRSEIGRGFEGEIRVHRDGRASVVEYFVLAVPGDETLHARVLRLDRRIASGLRHIDPHAEVRLQGEPPDRQRPSTPGRSLQQG
jgi:hypothetical protein